MTIFANNRPVADPDVLRFMIDNGGSFASALARAWLHADPINSFKLFKEWGDLYAEFAEWHHQIEPRATHATPR